MRLIAGLLLVVVACSSSSDAQSLLPKPPDWTRSGPQVQDGGGFEGDGGPAPDALTSDGSAPDALAADAPPLSPTDAGALTCGTPADPYAPSCTALIGRASSAMIVQDCPALAGGGLCSAVTWPAEDPARWPRQRCWQGGWWAAPSCADCYVCGDRRAE